MADRRPKWIKELREALDTHAELTKMSPAQKRAAASLMRLAFLSSAERDHELATQRQDEARDIWTKEDEWAPELGASMRALQDERQIALFPKISIAGPCEACGRSAEAKFGELLLCDPCTSKREVRHG